MKHLSLTWRLIFISLIFGVLPIVGWWLVDDFEGKIEQHHQDYYKQQTNNLRLLIEQLVAQDGELQQRLLTQDRPEQFVVQLRETGILVDGFSDEWYPYLAGKKQVRNFGQNASLILVEDQDYLYGLYQIEDNEIVYRASQLGVELSDKVMLNIGPYRLQFRPIAPGKTAALRQTSQGFREVTPIYAQWQENSKGYSLEFRIPQALVGDSIFSEIHDIDMEQQQRKLQGIYSFTNFEQLKLDSQLRSGFFQQLSSEHYRLTVVNTKGDVLYQLGELSPSLQSNWKNKLWLPQLSSSGDFEIEMDNFKGKTKISSSTLDQALSGDFAQEWLLRKSITKFYRALSPIHKGNQTIGAIVIESSPVQQKLQVRHYWMWFSLALGLVWLLCVWLMLRQSRKMSRRIRSLRDKTEQAVTDSGQILKVIEMDERFDDEVADLTNSFSYLTHRLKQYHDYQEKLVARLNHELRTPIAIIRSSLDNLSLNELSVDEQKLLDSAQSGASRLSQTLSRLSEANRLEQAIHNSEKIAFDANELLQQLLASYQLNWPEHQFIYEAQTTGKVYLQGSPELFVQMMDKLISNAVDFDNKTRAIKVCLSELDKLLELSVGNAGPTIDRKQLKDIFSLMHSSRKTNSNHLGLGLYIARLIAQFHGGKIQARNRKDGTGVSIYIRWKNKHFTIVE
ncbi:MAG: histidine kinase [Kangiellaceae bacterium]|nr:histidine kinase [Kangiellaceae bacterium]